MEPETTDCSGQINSAQEYLDCTSAIISPVLEAILPVLAIVIGVQVLFAGIYVARRTVKAFEGSI